MKPLNLLLTLLTATFFLACSSDKEQLQVETNLTAYSEDVVDLQASGAKAYSWRQISGTPVVLINANSATASFIAPSVTIQESLVFELEAVTAQIQGENMTLKKQVSVVVHPKAIGMENTPDVGDTDMHSTSGEVEREENNTAENNDTLPDSVETQQENTQESSSSDTNTTPTKETNSTTQTTPSSKTQTSATLKSLKLTLEKNSLNIETNTTLKVVATYQDNTTKDVTNQVAWNFSDTNAVQITQKSLYAKKDTNIFIQAKLNNITSNQVALEIYKEISGHRLPPEPDPTINNATLLGVDTNDNGVRDDVERWVYETYEEPVEIGIMLQSSYAYQKVIVDPSKAHETVKYSDAVLSCAFYWRYDSKDYVLDKNKDREARKQLKKMQFNSIARHMAYERYNAEFHGEVLSAPDASKEKCLFGENGHLKVQP